MFFERVATDGDTCAPSHYYERVIERMAAVCGERCAFPRVSLAFSGGAGYVSR